jgi:hypothetical protein
VLVLGACVTLLVGVCRLVPRANYYLSRARYHAQLEQARRSAVEESRRELARIACDKLDSAALSILSGNEEYEGYLALRHAKQRQQYRRAAYCFWEGAPADLPLPYPWDRERDRRVMETALFYDLNERNALFGDARRGPFVGKIVVDRLTSVEIAEDLLLVEVVSSLGFLSDLAQAFDRRNAEGPIPLEEFRFRDARMIIDQLDRLRQDALDKYPDGVGFVQVSLPGYSRDGKHALVAITGVLSNHHSGVVFALDRSSGEWRVSGSYNVVSE